MFPEHTNRHRLLKRTYVGNFFVSTVCLDFTTAMYETMVFECDPEDEDVTGNVVDTYTLRSSGRSEAELAHGHTVIKLRELHKVTAAGITIPHAMGEAYKHAQFVVEHFVAEHKSEGEK